jgi:O-acetyl-ADP-ribose deacetylase (regulator of RNase III)
MKLKDYIEEIAMREVLERPETYVNSEKSDIAIRRVIEFLTEEEGRTRLVPPDRIDARRLLRALLNVRPPGRLPADILRELDRLLWTERVEAGIVLSNDIAPISESFGYPGRHGDVLCLWQGDITRLEADAIVNAANKALLGCFSPLHACIDNCIHSAAGPQLREDCATIMAIQKQPEPAGRAKITRGYNLPAHFVLHTVGPIVQSDLTDQHREALAACYVACLDLAAEAGGVNTIAFCSISTGVYGFPADEASPIAVNTVSRWLDKNRDVFGKIIFDVYSQDDHEHYRRLFTR